MKKILLVFVCSLFAFETVLAQEKNAVGLRLGDGVEFLYQRDLSSRNFLQFTLATPHFEGLSVTGIYNWRCCRWNWTPGLAIGIWMPVWVEPWGFMTLTIRVFYSVWPAPALSAVISKMPRSLWRWITVLWSEPWSAVDMTASLIPDSGISDCPSNSIFETMNDRYIFLIAV